MCLAIPGQITKIKTCQATVKYPQNDIKQAKIITGSYKTGDYVIVQAGLVIEKVPKKQVEMWNKFIQ
ncbi:MAG: HypC/HybG/HupF family hydrogenase formation chaperone [Patescibacteria group bacterium]